MLLKCREINAASSNCVITLNYTINHYYFYITSLSQAESGKCINVYLNYVLRRFLFNYKYGD